MKKQNGVIETNPDAVRAGVISSLVIAICYLNISGLSSVPRVWGFMLLFAVCFVLMMKSIVDLLVWTFGLTAYFLGIGFGRVVRFVRRID